MKTVMKLKSLIEIAKQKDHELDPRGPAVVLIDDKDCSLDIALNDADKIPYINFENALDDVIASKEGEAILLDWLTCKDSQRNHKEELNSLTYELIVSQVSQACEDFN
jgi:hypothetical protein